MAAAVRMVVAARAEAEAVTEVAMEAAAMEAAAREAAAAEEATPTARRREGGGAASGPCRARTSACRSRVAARCRGTWRR